MAFSLSKAASKSKGGLMVRVGAEGSEAALARPHARPMEMRGRPMTGWVRVDAEGLASKRQLAAWVQRGVRFARSLPPKG